MVDFEMMHQLVDDGLLDELAAQAGSASRIGRLSFAPDMLFEALYERLQQRQVRSVLEFGCGRGTFARWLVQRDAHLEYLGVDRAPSAIAAAQRAVPQANFQVGDYRTFRTPPVGAVIFLDGLLTPLSVARAQRFVSMLEPQGTLFIGATLLHDEYVAEFNRFCLALRTFGCDVTFEDWTDRFAGYALAMAASWLNTRKWPAEVSQHFQSEARDVVDAIGQQRFTYVTVDAIRKL
ncbi:MAG TPA: methyltransferase domain-containing protein [Candidatus Baltobacteraceae bacterium]|nr:methyltransferase domain-containing protein [Candidatus Baltobacteraceae bacterium]